MPAYARALLLAGLALAGLLTVAGAQAPAEPHPVAAATATARTPTFHSVRTYETVAEPVRLRIPALHVDTRLDRLGLQPDGTVAVPQRTDVAGWWDGGPRPGQPGPAVLLGHVDSKTGPGVFIGLHQLTAGSLIVVERADGSSAAFTITALDRVPKTRFPTDLVYAPTLDPTLRLVTCGGSFDRSKGSYRDNVIAFAVLV
jgi:hypothetical protein